MKSLVSFVLRFNLDFLSVFIILDEYRGIADKCSLNRAANFFPRVLFVVELESYDKHDHFVNVHSDVPLLCQSLQIVCSAWCLNLKGHFPYTYEKFIFSRNSDLIRRVYVQGRGVGETQPERSASQVKQGAFTCSEVTFN